MCRSVWSFRTFPSPHRLLEPVVSRAKYAMRLRSGTAAQSELARPDDVVCRQEGDLFALSPKPFVPVHEGPGSRQSPGKNAAVLAAVSNYRHCTKLHDGAPRNAPMTTPTIGSCDCRCLCTHVMPVSTVAFNCRQLAPSRIPSKTPARFDSLNGVEVNKTDFQFLNGPRPGSKYVALSTRLLPV